MKNRLLIFSILFLLIFPACKSKKTVSSTPDLGKLNAKDVRDRVIKAEFDFETFSGRSKIKLPDGFPLRSVGAFVRVNKSDTIWSSVTGPLGIEGGRLLVTTDSAYVIDKLNREFYTESFSFLSDFLGYPMNFEMLESMVVGKVGMFIGEKIELIKDPNFIIFTTEKNNVIGEFTVNPKNYTIMNMRLKDAKKVQSLNVKFDEYVQLENAWFPNKRSIEVKSIKQQFDLEVNYVKASFNEEIQFPFKVPSGYTKK